MITEDPRYEIAALVNNIIASVVQSSPGICCMRFSRADHNFGYHSNIGSLWDSGLPYSIYNKLIISRTVRKVKARRKENISFLKFVFLKMPVLTFIIGL